MESAIDVAKRYTESMLKGVDSDSPTDPPTETELEAQKQAHLRQVWGKTLRNLDEIRDIDTRIELAPQSRWFGEDRASLQNRRLDTFATLARLLEDPQILRHREQIGELRQKIAKLSDRIAELQEQRVMALAGERDELDGEIAALKSDIATLEASEQAQRQALQQRFKLAGLELTDAQLTALLARVDADDLLSMTLTLDVLKDITARLMSLMQASGENLGQARRYYGMYVAMLEFVRYMQDSYVDKLQNIYLPRVARLVTEAQRIQSEALQMLSTERSPARKRILQRNLEAQALTLKVARLYRQQMKAQKKKVERARAVVEKDFRVARNTYDTVRLGADLVRLMQVNQEAFAAIMNIQIPEIVPFENIEMQRKFEELSRLIER